MFAVILFMLISSICFRCYWNCGNFCRRLWCVLNFACLYFSLSLFNWLYAFFLLRSLCKLPLFVVLFSFHLSFPFFYVVLAVFFCYINLTTLHFVWISRSLHFFIIYIYIVISYIICLCKYTICVVYIYWTLCSVPLSLPLYCSVLYTHSRSLDLFRRNHVYWIEMAEAQP